MSILLLIFLALVCWFGYRVFVSGPGHQKSFRQLYKDQNEVRKRIQDQGGIHRVESESISRLKRLGYEIAEYGENYVELVRTADAWSDEGVLKVAIIHNHDRKRLLEIGYEVNPSSEPLDPPLTTDRVVQEEDEIVDMLQNALSKHLSDHPNFQGDVEELTTHFTAKEPPPTSNSSSPNSSGTKTANKSQSEQNDHHEDSLLSAEEFADRFRILRNESMEKLRSDDTVRMENVNFSGRRFTEHTGVKSTLLFDIATEKALGQLKKVVFKGEDVPRVLWDDVVDIGLMVPRYVEYTNNSLPSWKIPSEGQKCDVSIKLKKEGGQDTLEIENFHLRDESGSIVLFVDGHRVTVDPKPLDTLPPHYLIPEDVFTEKVTVIPEKAIDITKRGRYVDIDGAYVIEKSNRIKEKDGFLYTFGAISENELKDAVEYSYIIDGKVYFEYQKIRELKKSFPTMVVDTTDELFVNEGDYCIITISIVEAVDELIVTDLEAS